MRILIVVIVLLCPVLSFAVTGAEAWSLGAFGGIVTANEGDLNTLITRANARGSISTPQFGNAYEFGGYLQRRFNGSAIAISLRPSYFTDSTTGSGSGGTYSYSLSGFAFAPLLRAYILEGNGIKLYIQGGINWGTLSGKIQEGSATVNFSGSNFGYQGGLGVDFCLGARSQHCIWAEGNVRYLSIDRNIASDSSGTFASGSNASLSQATRGMEVEVDGHDLSTTMSGIQALIGYQYNL